MYESFHATLAFIIFSTITALCVGWVYTGTLAITAPTAFEGRMSLMLWSAGVGCATGIFAGSAASDVREHNRWSLLKKITNWPLNYFTKKQARKQAIANKKLAIEKINARTRLEEALAFNGKVEHVLEAKKQVLLEQIEEDNKLAV